MDPKINLFLDMDDTTLKSSEAIIKILNKRYGLKKKYDDLTDWTYNSIYPKSNSALVTEMYDSDEFFNSVEIESAFKEFYKKNRLKFNFSFVTKGHEQNLSHKQKFVDKNFPTATLVPLPFKSQDSIEFSKTSVDMNYGIQIDDRMDCLEGTNASIKILYTHGKKLPWNRPTPNTDNLYICSTWEEIIDIINTANTHRFLMERIYSC